MKLHPANRLALWFWLASLLPWLERQLLFAIVILIGLFALLFARTRFLRALPRLRWLLLAMGAVYGWTTPGQYLWSGWFSPTYEGLWLGGAQIARLFAVMASLQILLTKMDRPAIFAGLHVLAGPFDWLGLSRNRMALRLTLTLEMMENLLEERRPFRHLMHELQETHHAERRVALPVNAMSPVQRLFLLGVLGSIVLTLWFGGFGLWE